MTRTLCFIACLMTALAWADGGELDKKVVEALTKQLGADGFRDRRKAQKELLAGMGALQTKYLELLAKKSEKPSEEVTTLGTRLKELTMAIEAVAKSAGDPEIAMRTKKIFATIYPSFIYDQDFAVQKLIVADFKNTALDSSRNSGKMAKVTIYHRGKISVMEIADLRVIRFGGVKNSSYESSDKLPLNYEGGWSSSGGDFSFDAGNGNVKCTWSGWTFNVNGYDLAIGDKKITIGAGKNLLMVDENGNYKCHFKLNH